MDIESADVIGGIPDGARQLRPSPADLIEPAILSDGCWDVEGFPIRGSPPQSRVGLHPREWYWRAGATS
jgi:hypothetical protein